MSDQSSKPKTDIVPASVTESGRTSGSAQSAEADPKQAQNDFATVFAAHPVFGPYISHHPARRLLLVIRAGLGYAVVVVILQALTWNWPDQQAGIVLPIAYSVAALVATWYALHLWNREVFLYKAGFTYREGSRLAEFWYRDIAVVAQTIEEFAPLGLFPRILYDVHLKTHQDEVMRITNLYADTKKLVDRLDVYIARDRRPIVEQRLKLGDRIDFGATLGITRDHIIYEGHELPWDDFITYVVRDGQLRLRSRKNEEWVSIPVTELVNVVLLLGILKSQRKEQPA